MILGNEFFEKYMYDTGQILYELGYVPSSYRSEKQENRQDRVGGP